MSTSRAKTKFSRGYAEGSFEWAEAILAHTGRLTPEQVALVLEQNPDTPLTRTLKHYLLRLKRRERRSGVKPRNAAVWEFILFDAKTLYESKLADLRGQPAERVDDAAEVDEGEAAAQACKAVLDEMKLCQIDWPALKNLLSLPMREPALFFGAGYQSCPSHAALAA